jgi:hypothetical protein
MRHGADSAPAHHWSSVRLTAEGAGTESAPEGLQPAGTESGPNLSGGAWCCGPFLLPAHGQSPATAPTNKIVLTGSWGCGAEDRQTRWFPAVDSPYPRCRVHRAGFGIHAGLAAAGWSAREPSSSISDRRLQPRRRAEHQEPLSPGPTCLPSRSWAAPSPMTAREVDDEPAGPDRWHVRLKRYLQSFWSGG